MPARLSKHLLIVAALCSAVLAFAWFHEGRSASVGSITVKLPPAHSSPRPGFKF